MTPRITVAVCTWNRAKSLKRALDSIVTAIEVYGSSVQLIVVNNNCTDDTDQIIAAISKRTALTYLHESRAGLANARNAATCDCTTNLTRFRSVLGLAVGKGRVA